MSDSSSEETHFLGLFLDEDRHNKAILAASCATTSLLLKLLHQKAPKSISTLNSISNVSKRKDGGVFRSTTFQPTLSTHTTNSANVFE